MFIFLKLASKKDFVLSTVKQKSLKTSQTKQPEERKPRLAERDGEKLRNSWERRDREKGEKLIKKKKKVKDSHRNTTSLCPKVSQRSSF